MENLLLEIIKYSENNYDKITVFKNGEVNTELSRNGIITKNKSHFDYVKELETQLLKAFDIMILFYDKAHDENYKISFNGHDFYSFDLYVDIYLMLKSNKNNTLSIFTKYNKEKDTIAKQNNINEKIKILDDYQKTKKVLEINTDMTTDNERNIISFKFENKINFELGESRFFSNTIDIAEDVDLPKSLEFVGQLNLNKLSKYDEYNLLPKRGTLYFFQSPFVVENHSYEYGKVIYSDNNNFKRIELTSDNINNDVILNYGIKEITNTIEKFSDRYSEYNGEINYNSYAGEDMNKIYGFYNDCQMSEEDIKRVSNKYIILLQLGSDIYGEGITTFMISEEDLKNKNFNNIIYKYVQS